MGRFYKTAVPEFVENYMYQPPWELAKQAMAVNEQGIQDSLNAANLLKNIDINYIPEAGQKAIVDRIQKKYAEAADNISKNIQLGLSQSPESWKKFSPEISNLGSTLQKDIKSGEIATITQSYNNHNKWLEDNKDIKEKDPLLYQAAYNTFMTRWMKNPERTDVWQGEDLPDFDIHSKDIMDGLKEFEADIKSQIGGGYIKQTEELTKDKIVQAYMGRVMSDPKAKAYLQKAIQYGVPGFVDENGKPLNIFVPVNNFTGEEVPLERFYEKQKQWQEMTPEERTLRGKREFNISMRLNPNHSWAKAFDAYGEQRSFTKETLKGDPVWAKQQDMKLAYAKMAQDNYWKSKEFNYRATKEADDKIKHLRDKLDDVELDLKTQDPKSVAYKKAVIMKEKITAQLGAMNIAANPNKSEITSTQTLNVDYDKAKNILNYKNKNTREYATISSINKNISGKAIKSLGITNREDLEFLSSLGPNDHIPTAVKNFLDKKRKGTSGKLVIEDFVPESLAYRKPLAPMRGYEYNDSRNYTKLINLGKKYRDKMKSLWNDEKVSGIKTPVSIYPINNQGKDEVLRNLKINSNSYNVAPFDAEGSIKMSAKDLAEYADFQGVVFSSQYGEGSVFTTKGEKPRKVLVYHNGISQDSKNTNIHLYGNPSYFDHQDSRDLSKLLGENNTGASIKSIVSQLMGTDNFAGSDKDYNKLPSKFSQKPLDLKHYKPGVQKGPKLERDINDNSVYYSTDYPLSNGNAISVDYYPIKGQFIVRDASRVRSDPNSVIGKTKLRQAGESDREFNDRTTRELEGMYFNTLLFSNKNQ